MELLRYLAADALDASYCLDIELLRGELDGSVAGMDSCELHVFTDRIGDDASVVRNGVELDLLGMFDETAYHDRVLLRDFGGQLKEALQLLFVGANVHRRSGKHVGRSYQYGEADFAYESGYILP